VKPGLMIFDWCFLDEGRNRAIVRARAWHDILSSEFV
jgi:hypothetical protein